MVLVQEDYVGTKNPIYHLSQNLNVAEIRYTDVENFSFVVVRVIQRFHHYILLTKTMVVSYSNPMTYILSCQFLGGKYSNGSSSSKSLTWNSSNLSQRNPWFSLSLCSTFVPLILNRHLMILSLMSGCFRFIYRPILSGLIPLTPRSVVFDTNPRITSSLVTPFVNTVLIQFYKGTSHMRRMRISLMNSTQGHVMVIYLAMLPHKRSYTLITFGLQFFKIVFFVIDLI